MEGLDIGTLGGTHAARTAINNLGDVMEYSTTTTGDFHAFLWKNGGMRDLGNSGGKL